MYTMKKGLSLFLSILMLLSCVSAAPFTAFARDIVEQGEITLDETASAVLSDRDIAQYNFTAPETRYYEFIASSPVGATVSVTVTDKNGEETGKSTIGKYYANLTEGTTYTVQTFFPFSDYYGTANLTVKNHEHSGSKNRVAPTCKADGSYSEYCSSCSYSYREVLPKGPEYHVFEYGKCRLCGAKDPDFESKIVPLTENEAYNGEITYRAEIKYFSFTPAVDGYYEFVTTGDYNADINLYDGDWTFINSRIRNVFGNLEGGKTYYISFSYQSYSQTAFIRLGKFSITAALHEHDNKTTVFTKATCISEGKQRISCNTCYQSTDEVIPIDPDAHKFTDNVCQLCGYVDPDYVAPSVTLENAVESEQTSVNGSTVYYYFTADEDAYYYISFRHDARTNFYYSFYDSDGNYIIEETEQPSSSKPIKTELEGGKTYTLTVRGKDADANARVWAKIGKHTHTVSTYVKKAPTCVTDGERRTYCTTYCGYDITEPIPATGVHVFVNGKCKYCDEVDESYVKVENVLTENEEAAVENVISGEERYYAFTPEKTGLYCLAATKAKTGSGMDSPSFSVKDENGEGVKLFSFNTGQWLLKETRYYNLEAGKTYHITVKANSDNGFTLMIEKHEHDYKANGYTPRCNEYVTVTYTCSCKDSYKITYEPTGEHQFNETVVAPTCVDSGYSEMKCKTCGKSYKYAYTPSDPEAHIFKNGICTECGTYEFDEDRPLLKINTVTSFTMHDEDEEIEVRFIPDETDYYYFRSTGSYDVYAEMYDMDFNDVADDDDSGGRYNFHMAAYLEANKEYIIYFGNYEDFEEDITGGAFTFDVICGKHTHSYTSEVIAPTAESKGYTLHECVCGDTYVSNVKNPVEPTPENTCQHNYVKYRTYAPTCVDGGYTIYYCTKCYDTYNADITDPTGVHYYLGNYCDYCGIRKPRAQTGETYALTLGAPTDVTIASTDEKIYLTFTPEESGTYLFTTKGTYDVYAVLYDVNGNELCVDKDNSGSAKNAQIAYEMTAGTDYRFELQLNSGSNAAFTALIEKHVHDFADYIVPATCGEDGIGIHTCKTCFYSYEDVPERATGNHDYDEKGVCKNCGYSDIMANAIHIRDFNNVTVPALEDYVLYTFTAPHSGMITVEGHSNSVTVAVLLADDLSTHIADGDSSGEGMNFRLSAEVSVGVTYYLLVNSLSREYEISFDFSEAHSYELINKVEPTCTEQGLSIFKCRECGKLNYDNYTDPIPHDYQKQILPATCTENGITVYTCSVCGDSYSEVINAKGHKAVIDPAVEPTYTRTGLTEGSHCTVCGEILVKQKVVPKLEKPETTVIKLKRPKITKFTAGRNKLTVKWTISDTTNVSAYEIQYSTSKKFKKGKTKTVKANGWNKTRKKIKKLKSGKKYYVRVRSCKKINGKWINSKWSKKKSVKVK